MPLQILIGASLIIALLDCLQKISGKFIHSQVVSFFFFLCEYEALNDLCEMT